MNSESSKHSLLHLQSFSRDKILIICNYQIHVIWLLLHSCLYFVDINFIGEISESENRFQTGRSVVGWEHAVLNCPHSTANVYESWVPMPLPFIDYLRTEATIWALQWQFFFFKKVWAENVELQKNWLSQHKVSRVIHLSDISEVVAKCNSHPLGKFQSSNNCFCPKNIQAMRNVHVRH